jgi:hypothetical protein
MNSETKGKILAISRIFSSFVVPGPDMGVSQKLAVRFSKQSYVPDRSHFFKEGKRGYVNFYAVRHLQRFASCRRVNFHRFVNVYLCGHLSFENLTDLF